LVSRGGDRAAFADIRDLDELARRVSRRPASETCALDMVGAEFVREVENGEVIVVTKDGIESHRPFPRRTPRPCAGRAWRGSARWCCASSRTPPLERAASRRRRGFSE
jgi:hypothetical protein